jgi:drug/metabolite transporter (DMT)-like permease
MKTFSKMKKFNKKTWIYLFVGLIMSTIGFFIFLNLIQRAMPSFVISILNPLTIIVTVLVGMWFFHQKINVWMWMGIGLVTAGIVLIGIKGPKTEGTSAFGG